MNKRYLVIAAAVAMLALIAGAVALDCVRLAAQARHRVDLADHELAKHEQRLATLLASSPALTPEVKSAITAYEAPASPPARRAAYDKLVAAFRQSMQTAIDPTNALDRKFMDDVAGAINRHEIAAPSYDAEMSAYQAYLSSPRGAIARWFSPPDEAEWNAK
jgi:hypothetical protein